MTRRDILLASCAFPLLAKNLNQSSRLSVEGYIFQQYAQSLKKPLADVLPEVFAMARTAGYRNIELNSAFFANGTLHTPYTTTKIPDVRDRCLRLLRANNLYMPSVYVGGPMHEKSGADATIQNALEIGALCKPFGCTAIVNNPDPKHDESDKTDAELAVEADSLNRMGRTLAGHGFELRVHHHTPQLVNNAREWRYILKNTDPKCVSICVDADWAYEGGFNPLAFIREVGTRLKELHVRSAKDKIWLEDVENSDIDYRAIAAYLQQANLEPLIVVELAYRPKTVITRSLETDLAISRQYTESVFHLT